MLHHRHRRALLARLATATASAIVVSAVALPALAAGQQPGRAASHDAAARPGAAAAIRRVLLINGDRLVLRSAPGGGRAVGVLSGPGATSLLSLHLGRLTEEIPAAALPYLGRGLDPSLFDLGALQRAEVGGRLPVRVRFAGRRPALPGVTITRSGPGSAEGYLTASSARVFGAALERQFRADHARASYGADGLFARGVDIALAGAPLSAPQRPAFPMHTLTVTASNLRGKPDNGDDVVVINADDWQTFGDGNENYNFFYHGAARYSVPAGHYWAIGDFVNFTRTSASERLVVLPQFTVKGKSTTVHLAERTASSKITMVTPRPAQVEQVGLTMIRGGLHGTSASVGWFDSGISLWVSPTTAKPTVGTLRTFTSAQLISAPKAVGPPYVYNLDYAGPDGTIPPQRFVVTPASLATIHERYYQDITSTGGWGVFGGFPVQWQGGIFTAILPLQLPGLQTQYMSAGPSIIWSGFYSEFYSSMAGGQTDTFRTLVAGRQWTENWNRYPLHSQPAVNVLQGRTASLFEEVPSAFRLGNTLQVSTTPFSDNQQGHSGAGFFAGSSTRVTGSYAIYQNGVRIGHGNPVNGINPVRLGAAPSVIRFALSAARWSRLYPLSPSSTTVWTWRSAREPSVKLPPSWFCGYLLVGQQLKVLRRCAVQPMLTLSYQVHGLSLSGLTPAGQQVIGLSVGHIQLAKDVPITGAHAQVSYDGGLIWQRAFVVSTGAGSFRIAFNAPAGVDVTLRVSATDAAGSSITETILRAYGVGL